MRRRIGFFIGYMAVSFRIPVPRPEGLALQPCLLEVGTTYHKTLLKSSSKSAILRRELACHACCVEFVRLWYLYDIGAARDWWMGEERAQCEAAIEVYLAHGHRRDHSPHPLSADAALS